MAERVDQLHYDLRHRDRLSGMGVRVDVEAVSEELERLKSMPQEDVIKIEYDDGRLEKVRLRQHYAARCIRELGSVVEVCPTSNRRIGGISNGEYHPVRQFVDFGVPFVVGSDDPGVFDTTLNDEIQSAIAVAGLPGDSYEELVERAWQSRSEVLTGRL